MNLLKGLKGSHQEVWCTVRVAKKAAVSKEVGAHGTGLSGDYYVLRAVRSK